MIQAQPQKRILNVQATGVYESIIDNIDAHKILCLEGGSRSSKTWSIFQYLMFDVALAGKKETLTIVRDKLTWIRSTLLKDFEEMTSMYGIKTTPEINLQRQDQVYKINGTEFGFFGLDYPQKLHGRKQHRFWINEAVPEASKMSFDQLEQRTEIGGFVDYNPIDDQHWIFDLQKRPDVKMLKSSWRDNPFLAQPIIDKLLSYEPTPENIAQGTADLYMWEVYGQGNKARLQGTIFNNWDIVEGVPEEAKFLGYGLDFGFTNDPTAMVGLYMMDNELYADEVLYQTGMTNQDIVKYLELLEIKRNDDIVGDSAEPKSIEEIYRSGFNIYPAEKGIDSVKFGIDLLNSFKLHITRRSINLEMELRRYKYAEDKNGRSLNKPIDAFNHCFVGDTLITMGNLRHKKIKDIKVGEFVLTSKGRRRVRRVFNNGSKRVFDYSLHTGIKTVNIRCTPEHLVKTGEKQWTKISELRSGKMVYLCNDLMGKNTTYTRMKSIFQNTLQECIARFGSITREAYRKGLMFITKTKTHGTIELRTSNLYRPTNICLSMENRGLRTIPSGLRDFIQQVLRRQKIGTNQKRGKNGILNMENPRGFERSDIQKSAKSVERNTKHTSQVVQNSVIKTVNKDAGTGGFEIVYDLEVENTHEYFANGVLVHNCIDALRYTTTAKLRRKSEVKVYSKEDLGF